MGYCEDCKFWQRGSYGGTQRLGACTNKEKLKRGYHINVEEILDDEAIIENDEGWAIMTGPKFGCVHFTKKGNDDVA